MNSVRLIIKFEISSHPNEPNVNGGVNNSKGIETTCPFSFLFSARKERQRADSSGSTVLPLLRRCKKGKGAFSSPLVSLTGTCYPSKAHPLCGRSTSSGFTP